MGKATRPQLAIARQFNGCNLRAIAAARDVPPSRVLAAVSLGRAGEPPADAAPMPVVAGPRTPLAGPGQVAVEVDHG